MGDELTQSFDTVYGDAVDYSRLFAVFIGDVDLLFAEVARGDHHRQHAGHTAHVAGERELAYYALVGEIIFSRYYAVALQDGAHYSQVKDRALLLDIGGREVYH